MAAAAKLTSLLRQSGERDVRARRSYQARLGAPKARLHLGPTLLKKKLQLTSEKLLLLLLTHASSASLGLQERVCTSVLRVTTAS